LTSWVFFFEPKKNIKMLGSKNWWIMAETLLKYLNNNI
jgi:hypothetical protein